NTHSTTVDPRIPLQRFVNTSHQIAIITAAPLAQRPIRKLLPVTTRPARVQIQHAVTTRDVNLKRRIERPAKHPVWSTMDAEYQRALPIARAAGRPHQPTLNLRAVEAAEYELVGNDEPHRSNQRVVMRAHPTHGEHTGSRTSPDFRRPQRGAEGHDKRKRDLASETLRSITDTETADLKWNVG